MKFPRKRLDNCVRTVISMFFIFSTAIVFNASWASSDAVDVKNFAQLKKAVEDNKFKIEIVGGSDMKFSETIAIKRRNIGISGSGLGMVKFDGRNSSGFFDFDPGAEGIAIRNIEFANGKFEDERGIDARKASGGAFIIGAGASITLENTKFSGNVAIGSSGGAITSAKSSALIFRGRTNFDGNESKEGSGGAVYATGSSSLAFGEEVIFRNNKSSKAGGAVYSDRNSILLFKEEADFYDNKSGEVGGAIFANDSSSLTFEKETVFNDNKSCMGGAIYSQGNNILVFREKVTFRANDSSGKGGAIFAGTSGDINFSYGLGLVENTTGSKDGASGAIHMAGKGDSYIIKINIAQKDPFMSTVFRGNMSGDRCVAVYMEKYSALNFFLEEGDVNIFDAIEGDRTENSNTVTIEGSGGQFNLREEGSINNVNLINRGVIINLEESKTAVSPLNFRNSGKIMFRIFPGNNKCSRIQARDIILEEGTTLEIDAAQGTYEAGNSYDIIVSENTIIKPENIYIKLPREFAQGLRIRAVIQDKFYRLFIESDGEDDVDDEDIDSKK